MQLPRRVVGGLGVLVAAALVPGTAPAGGAEVDAGVSSQARGAAASCTDEGGNGAVRTPKLVRQIDTG